MGNPQTQPAPNIRWRFFAWLLGEAVGQEKGLARFARQRERDRIARDIHFVCACAWCFFVAWPVTFVEYAGIPLIACTFIRVLYTFGLSWSLFRQPLAMFCSIFWAWNAATLLWTPDLHQGVIQAGQARWLWCVFMLWPVIERRGWLIATLALGFLAGNGSQLAHAIGLGFDLPWLTFDRQPDRNSGWWQPVVGGSILCAALGLHLPAAILEQGRLRAVALAGVCVSVLGIIATGSRGAWLAALATIAVGLPLSAVFAARTGGAEQRRVARRWSLIFVVALVIAGGVGGAVFRGPILRRYELARSEIAAALEQGDYRSDTGSRIWMARTAGDALREHPVRGIGAGGFRAYCTQKLQEAGTDPLARPLHAHAHNTPLQIGATLGLVGLVLAALIAFVALWNGLIVASRTLNHPYALGPGVAIMAMFFAGMFDSIHVNTQTCAVFFVLLALCPSYLPEACRDARRAGGGA